VTLDQLLARVALGEARTTDYPVIAEQALAEGLESHVMAALAGTAAGERSSSELQDLLDRGLRQVERSVPERAAAGTIMRDYYASEVASGALSPKDGAAKIVRLETDLRDVLPSREYAGDGLGVARLLGLYYSHDDVAFNDDRAHSEINAELLAECRRLAGETAG
jgi:hypothetical protein